ncbi:cyclic lactone autoinducer peptide [Paenibacillus sp. UNCCL117]|nr:MULTISPECIES: hypothetical protein [unclassified Paenibacillus]SDD28913.1 cyclic lactone autoinducer peptide [Paenibacillus sp. cl123]SFW40839.1 cyclic lactone autoinducer peptide [Paenibacillus sp. UNCCL117]
MKTILANIGDSICTFFSKRLATTGCWWGCHREEAPDELFK